jgi:hypothetical protein
LISLNSLTFDKTEPFGSIMMTDRPCLVNVGSMNGGVMHGVISHNHLILMYKILTARPCVNFQGLDSGCGGTSS